MRKNRTSLAALVVATLALAIAMIGPANAAHLITGKDIKKNSITGKQVKESTLKAVPKANSLGILPSGKSESGVFAGGAGDSTTDYYGFGVSFPVPLGVSFNQIDVVDTANAPNLNHCPKPGEAAKGYLCLYPNLYSAVGSYGMYKAYGTSSLDPTPLSGIGIYVPVGGADSYVNGTWTVTSP